MEKKKFYLTTALAYTSRKPHIGNTYDVVLADMIARYKRMMGFDVFFLTGSDEHGQKIVDCAREQGFLESLWSTAFPSKFQRRLGLPEHHLRQIHPHHRRVS